MLRDLESKIELEIYLREKKAAILLDRQEQDDTMSHLSKIK